MSFGIVGIDGRMRRQAVVTLGFRILHQLLTGRDHDRCTQDGQIQARQTLELSTCDFEIIRLDFMSHFRIIWPVTQGSWGLGFSVADLGSSRFSPLVCYIKNWFLLQCFFQYT